MTRALHVSAIALAVLVCAALAALPPGGAPTATQFTGPIVLNFNDFNCQGTYTVSPVGTARNGVYPVCHLQEDYHGSIQDYCSNGWFGSTTYNSAGMTDMCTGTQTYTYRYATNLCVNGVGYGTSRTSYIYLCSDSEEVGVWDIPAALPGDRYVWYGQQPCTPDNCVGTLAWMNVYSDDQCTNMTGTYPLVNVNYHKDVCYAAQLGTVPDANIIFTCDANAAGVRTFRNRQYRSGCVESESNKPVFEAEYILDTCVWDPQRKAYTKSSCDDSNVGQLDPTFIPTPAAAPVACDARRTDQPGCPACDPTKRWDCCDARRTDQPGCPPCDSTKRWDCVEPTPVAAAPVTCDARRWDQPGCPPCDPTKRWDCCDARRTDQPGCPPCDPTKRWDCIDPTPVTCDARRWDQPGCPPCDPTKRWDCCDARRTDQPGCPACDPTKRWDCCDARRTDQPGCPPCDPTKRWDCVETPAAMPMCTNANGTVAPCRGPVKIVYPQADCNGVGVYTDLTSETYEKDNCYLSKSMAYKQVCEELWWTTLNWFGKDSCDGPHSRKTSVRQNTCINDLNSVTNTSYIILCDPKEAPTQAKPKRPEWGPRFEGVGQSCDGPDDCDAGAWITYYEGTQCNVAKNSTRIMSPAMKFGQCYSFFDYDTNVVSYNGLWTCDGESLNEFKYANGCDEANVPPHITVQNRVDSFACGNSLGNNSYQWRCSVLDDFQAANSNAPPGSSGSTISLSMASIFICATLLVAAWF